MIRSFVAVGVTLLIVSVFACDGGADEPAPAPTIRPTPTATLVPTPTPLDPNVGCAAPLSERYCEESYRPPPASCHVSDVRDFIHVAPGIGRPPVWMVRSPVLGMPEVRPTPRVAWKTIWIVDYRVEGEVRLTGRRLDGPGVAVFPVYQRDHTFELDAAGNRKSDWERTELVLIPPHGGDHRTRVYIPSPGCWQFTARTETETVEIVLYLYEREEPLG